MAGYPVPKAPIRVETRYGNSRFITSIARAASSQEAHAAIRAIRKEMPDATHHVYAFRVGHGATIQEGMSDDGEPSGTSGPPTLAVLRGSGVGDVVLVTTRYFGGAKLGTGGLVAAYTQAAQVALKSLVTEEKVDRVTVTLTVPYAALGAVRRLLHEHRAAIIEERFEAEAALTAMVPASDVEAVRRLVQNATAGKAQFTPAE